MNRLSLSQRLMLECSVSGTMSTTAGVTGEFLRVTTWIDAAWQAVQTRRSDWKWMRSSVLLGGGVSFATVAGQAVYPLGAGAGTVGIAASVFGKWVDDSFRCNTTTVGYLDENYLDPIGYEEWRNGYMYGAMRSVQTRPVAIAVAPNKALCIGPPSNALYTITGDYYTAPTVMTADTDEPTGLPVQNQLVIVYNAMMMYAGYEAASEVFQRGEAGYKRMMAELDPDEGPDVIFDGALA